MTRPTEEPFKQRQELNIQVENLLHDTPFNQMASSNSLDSVYQSVKNDVKKKTKGARKYNKNIFVRIVALLSNYTEKLNTTSNVIEEKQLRDVISLLTRVRGWLYNGEYLTDKAKEVVQLYFENDLNVKPTARACEMTEVAVRKTLTRATAEAEKVITPNLYNLLEQGVYEESLFYFNYKLVNTEALSVLNKDLLTMVDRKDTFEIFNLADCEYEIKILKLYALATMEKNVVKGNKAKFEYLINMLLGSHTMYDYERYLLTNFLQEKLMDEDNEKVDFKGFMQKVKEEHI